MKPTLKVVSGIIQKGNQVLIARKSDDRPEDSGIVNNENTKDFLLGLWHFPGGKVDEGENLELATKREVLQETSLDVKVGKLLGERIEERDKVILHIHWYECKYIDGKAKPGDDIVEVKWVEKNLAPGYCAKKVVEQWPEGVLKQLKS